MAGKKKKIRIVADDRIPFLRGALDKVADVIYVPGKEMTNALVKDADALIIRTRTKCDEHLLQGSNVKFIATATIGFDHIDTNYSTRKRISWTNAPGCNSSSVEQYLMASLLDISNKFHLDLNKTTLGVVGVGYVGSKVASSARELGMKVLENDPPRQRRERSDHFVDLHSLKKKADIITFHVPLNCTGEDKTFQLIDKEFFHDLDPGKIIINTSRGEIMNEDILIEKLKDKTLLTSVIDVWNHEPDIDLELLDLSAIATPHIAGYSVNGKLNGTAMSVQAVSRFFKLERDNWMPQNPPVPDNSKIILDCTGMKKEDIIRSVYEETYSIREDDRRLREHPEKFEELRGSYPQRFEPSMYNVRLINPGDKEVNGIMEALGFSVLELDCFC